MSGFIKKTLHHIDAWQGTDYSSGSTYTKVLNIPGLHKVLKKMNCIIDAWEDSKYSQALKICHGSKYARVAQGSEQNIPL